jgi:lipoprotein-releasing system permease protein
VLASVWESLSLVGGSIAVTFIVGLALGMVALANFYVGSAVIVLERFARSVTGVTSVVMMWLLACMLASFVALVWDPAAVGSLDTYEWSAAWARTAGLAAPGVALMIGVAWCLLRFLRPARLAELTVATLSMGFSLAVGGLGRWGWSLAPALVAVAVGCLLLVLRRRRQVTGPSVAMRLLGVMIVSLVLGAALGASLAGGFRDPGLATAGSWLLGSVAALLLLGLLPLAGAGLLDLRRSVEWFIAVRYLLARRRQVFISAITAICVAGIAAGVWLIVVVLSVMNGFERTWREEILGNRAHFTVQSAAGPFPGYRDLLERVRQVDGVTGVSPFLDAEGMVRGDGGRIHSVRVRGIDPSTAGDVTELPQDLILGSLSALAAYGNGDDPAGAAHHGPPILIGNQLAMSLGVGLGDPLLLISPYGGTITPLGPAPRLKRFEVAGVFETSFFQYDEVYTYVSISAAQDFRNSGDVVDGIEARTTDFYRSRAVGREVANSLDYPFFTRDWKDSFPAFFQALKTERIMMFLLLTMINVVAAFVIVTTLIMMIMEKSSDIAILKAMGAEDDLIERVFAIEGTLIGLVGTAIGVVAGIAVTNQLEWIQDAIEWVTGIDTLPASIYQLSTLPSEVDPLQVAFVAAMAMVFSLGATLLPSYQGARLDPAEGLRYE